MVYASAQKDPGYSVVVNFSHLNSVSSLIKREIKCVVLRLIRKLL